MFLIGLVVLIIVSCSGSDFYQGKWFAIDSNGDQYEITFKEKELVVTDTSSVETSYEYSQNAVSNNNGVRTYGIKLKDGRYLSIVFPYPKDSSIGVIKNDNDDILYILGRNDYVSYDDLY